MTTRPSRALAVAGAAVGLLACSAPQRPTRVPGCVPSSETTSVIEVVVGDTVRVPPPCPDVANAYFNSPIELTPSADGLQVRFSVFDSDVAPRQSDEALHDVAVVYPGDESLGRSAVELATTPNGPRQRPGYLVEDTLAWGTWGMSGPDGGFRLVIAIIDREPGGGTTEVREVLDVRVRARR